MSLDQKRKRLAELQKVPGFAARDHRLFKNEEGQDKRLAALPRAQRRKIEKEGRVLAKEYFKVMRQMQQSGAGYPVDQLLRQLAVEYTNRYALSGIDNQPLSFNYFEAFCDIKLLVNSVAPYAEPNREVDHLFSVEDFFEYSTSDQSSGFDISRLEELPEKTVLHFTTNGSINDFTFSTAAGREFLISGFSMLRYENFVHWYIVGGEVFSDTEWEILSQPIENVDLVGTPPWKRAFVEEARSRFAGQPGGPLPLEGTARAQRTVVAGELDLTTRTHVARCYMRETENAFVLVSDDPDLLRFVDQADVREQMTAQFERQIADTAVMWGLGEAMLQLPAYFAYKFPLSKDVLVAGGKTARVTSAKGGTGLGVRFKTVSAIEVTDTLSTVVREYTPKHYKMNDNGYWRRLAPTQNGKGPSGEAVLGRTWIKASGSFRSDDDGTRTIYVKSTLASARLQVADFLELARHSAEARRGLDGKVNEKGVVYVLRCKYMLGEIFKVGWTSGTATERAKELSSATGVPTSFIVVDHWQHPKASGLEKNLHALLDPYRLDDSREFFRLPYRTLKQIIVREIERTDRV
ncbi:GIY-YIG nuclease family protein [Neorhizobium galegae]|uniref:Putative phage-derived protein n=1 Tax=Neorhizobium galegae bv. officinalis TaxID=323656 RepID=A0A0T7GIH0_NEOGA|nr:GIY-YIG nuclease family protein [Neorhizobium galegae]CDZ46968.1 Putative phage-derived protein [Neorhizobium galegae bv. officinalis]